MILLTIFLILLIILIPLFCLYILPLLYSGIHYEKTTNKKIKTIKKIIRQKNTNINACDLGSGNGAILIHLAKEFPNSKFTGYEINPILTIKSKIKSRKIQNLEFKQKNFWKQNLKNFDTIIIFQYKTLMKKIENKIKKECKKNTTIISNHWQFPNIKKTKTENDIHIYKI
ncbi:MAG: class I SAM-dependent methyltransferase [Bacteroidales bacterium]|nr:class I SAM-dependent methyltransferase [Candidatus Woesearchaeota archaeon]MBN2893489.1 class I SAM-dependent methyltransferase [Bacteroidales bacterium]